MIDKKIKELRLKNNLTQKELASFLNLTPKMISFYELGERTPPMDIVLKLADYFKVSTDYLLKGEKNIPNQESTQYKKRGIKIPVLGRIQAGIPVEAIEEIIDYEEIDEELAKTGDFFCLQIKGDSMAPRMLEGDVVVVRKQPDLENGQIGIVLVNGQDATIKKVVKHETGISLVAFNTAYPTRIFTFEDIETLPVVILGRVVELRGKF